MPPAKNCVQSLKPVAAVAAGCSSVGRVGSDCDGKKPQLDAWKATAPVVRSQIAAWRNLEAIPLLGLRRAFDLRGFFFGSGKNQNDRLILYFLMKR